jgi:large subunit ribosomal protein L18Ae
MVKATKLGLQQNVHLFEIVGRAAPTAKNATPKIFKMKIFSRNEVTAKSRFWYYMKSLCKAKSTGGELLSVKQIREKKPLQVKNFAVWLRYNSRSGIHNMYKEFRDTTLTGAISQMYAEMAGRHRARACNIQIMRTAVISDDKCKRENIQQYHGNVKFPLIRNRPLVPKQHRTAFKARRPNTFLQ